MCFAQVDGKLVTLDLATETITPTPHAFRGLQMSLGLTQDHLVACPFGEDTVDTLDLGTGVHTAVDMPCDAATAFGERIYVLSLSEQALTEYPDPRALIARTPSRVLPGPHASRLGAGNGRLLAAWHATDEVLAVNLDTAASTAIALPGYDGWIFGLFENAAVRIVAGGVVETGLNLYDTSSGKPVGRLFDGIWLQGLACAGTK